MDKKIIMIIALVLVVIAVPFIYTFVKTKLYIEKTNSELGNIADTMEEQRYNRCCEDCAQGEVMDCGSEEKNEVCRPLIEKYGSCS